MTELWSRQEPLQEPVQEPLQEPWQPCMATHEQQACSRLRLKHLSAVIVNKAVGKSGINPQQSTHAAAAAQTHTLFSH